MILPNKHILPQDSLLGLGGVILQTLKQPMTITTLWEVARRNSAVRSFERLLLALDFLYAIGAVDISHGLLRRRS
ncbi:ABC-three component system middle component 6 [Humidesulfovibrio sp.]|uniref:ABC-three component system middle component 6 n=1 Tax=Humidesulfovibrio sp. TaxID=2910988 RepID=UPI0035BE5AD0